MWSTVILCCIIYPEVRSLCSHETCACDIDWYWSSRILLLQLVLPYLIRFIFTELTIRRVVTGVLLMVLLLPGFDVEYGLWGRYQGVDRGGLLMLHDIVVSGGGNNTAAFNVSLQVHQCEDMPWETSWVIPMSISAEMSRAF
jgi:hypothetical protein